MTAKDPNPLDRLMYARIGPHLVHTFDGDSAVMRQSDKAAARKLSALHHRAKKPRTRRLS